MDIQREDRWPNATDPSAVGSGLKVKFPAWAEDSDYSDTEGMLGMARKIDLNESEDDL